MNKDLMVKQLERVIEEIKDYKGPMLDVMQFGRCGKQSYKVIFHE